MIGVSPSFFFSKYTTDFCIYDYIEGLESLKELGVDCFQGEIYKKVKINEWRDDGKTLAASYNKLNLKMSSFVAHFLINYTDKFDSLFSDFCFSDVETVCQIVKENFTEVETIVVPFAKYQIQDASKERYEVIWKRVVDVIGQMTNIANEYELKLALEIIPGSIIGGIDGLIRLIDETGAKNLGYNLDTGHANCSGEVLSLIPSKLKGKIFGTHLKDNFEKKISLLPQVREILILNN